MPDEHLISIDPDDLSEAAQAYLLHCRAAGHKPNTREVYERSVTRMVTHLQGQGLERVADVKPAHLEAFFFDLRRDHSKGGVEVIYRPVKAFFRWYWDLYEVETRNPIDRVTVEHQPVKARAGIPLEVVQRMVGHCHGHYKWRDTAVLEGLLDTCARASEFCALRVGDVNYVTGRTWIEFGKGDKARAVRFGDKALRALRRYLKQRGNKLPGHDPLIMSDKGGALDRFSLRLLIDRRADDAGVEHYGLHDFRRRGAYELWKRTRDLKAVSEYLGHASPVVTQRYLAVDEEDILEMHRRGSAVDHGEF